MVPLDGLNGIAGNEIALLERVLYRKWSFERVAFVLITAGESVLGVDHVIEITHSIVVFEERRYRISLQGVSTVHATSGNAGTGHQIGSICILELKHTDSHWVEIEQ